MSNDNDVGAADNGAPRGKHEGIKRKIKHFTCALVLAWAVIGLSKKAKLSTIKMNGTVTTVSNRSRKQQLQQISLSRLDRYEALKLHEKGSWQHYHFFAPPNQSGGNLSLSPEGLLSDKQFHQMYAPLELEWLAGRTATWDNCASHRDQQGLMYTSKMGNQCGCGHPDFQPSHSIWRGDGHDSADTSPPLPREDTEEALSSPSLRLIERLARGNQSLCFMGDSIDLQFYAALKNNIQRIILHQQRLGETNSSRHPRNITLTSRTTPANYTNETGALPGGWRYLKDIHETTVALDYNGDRVTASFSWYQTYGWMPVNTFFTEGCAVVIANLGLHYSSHTGKLENAPAVLRGRTLAGDLRAAVTHLAELAGPRSGRVAVWRSALPQHFATPDGHYQAKTACSPRPQNVAGSAAIQKYNHIYDTVFAEMCDGPPRNRSTESARYYEHQCTANRTSREYPTVYNYILENQCCAQRLARFREGGTAVTGTILRWDIADLFDVPAWHTGNLDCSHFCYIPAAYEAAFHRLELLLPPVQHPAP